MRFTTKEKILDGFNIKVEVLNYNRDLARDIYNTVKTTWHYFDSMDYDCKNKLVSSLVLSVLERHLNPGIIELGTIQLKVEGLTRVGMAHITRQRTATFNVSSQETQQPEFTNFVRPLNFEGKEEEFEKLVKASVSLYNSLVSSGISPQDARYVFPQCVECGPIIWNTTVNQLKNIALFRLCNTSSAAEGNITLRKYLEEFNDTLEEDLINERIDPLTYKVYWKLLKSTVALGSTENTFKSFATLIGDSGRFKKKAEIPQSLALLYKELEFNSLDFKKTWFFKEMKTKKYKLLPGEESVF